MEKVRKRTEVRRTIKRWGLKPKKLRWKQMKKKKKEKHTIIMIGKKKNRDEKEIIIIMTRKEKINHFGKPFKEKDKLREKIRIQSEVEKMIHTQEYDQSQTKIQEAQINTNYVEKQISTEGKKIGERQEKKENLYYFDKGDEMLVENRFKILAKVYTGFQLVMLSHNEEPIMKNP
jgi:hypothetical protein